MALYSCIGFGGGFVGTVLFGFTLDSFGGANYLGGWIASFRTAAVACLVGAPAMTFLARRQTPDLMARQHCQSRRATS